MLNFLNVLKRFWANVSNFQNVYNNRRTFGEHSENKYGEQSEAKRLGRGKIHSYNHEFLLVVKKSEM